MFAAVFANTKESPSKSLTAPVPPGRPDSDPDPYPKVTLYGLGILATLPSFTPPESPLFDIPYKATPPAVELNGP